jgi:hypothetical protein
VPSVPLNVSHALPVPPSHPPQTLLHVLTALLDTSVPVVPTSHVNHVPPTPSPPQLLLNALRVHPTPSVSLAPHHVSHAQQEVKSMITISVFYAKQDTSAPVEHTSHV